MEAKESTLKRVCFVVSGEFFVGFHSSDFCGVVRSSFLRILFIGTLLILLQLNSGELGAQPTKPPAKFRTTLQNIKFTDVVRDSNNHIWIGAFGALERYDGTLVRRYDSRGNLELVYRLFLDHKNRVWTADMNAGLSYVEHDTVRRYEYNDSVKPIVEHGNLRTMSFQEDGSIHLASDYHGYYSLESNGRLTNILSATTDYNGWVYIENKQGTSHTFFAHVPNYLTNDTFSLYVFDEQKLKLDVPIQVSNEVKAALIGRGVKGDVKKDIHGNYLFSFGAPKLFRVSKNGEIEEFELDHSVYEMFVDSRGEVWITSVEGVVYQYPADLREMNARRRVYFKDADGSTRSVVRCEDHEQGIWIAREEAGVFHIADRRQGLYDVKSGHLVSDKTMAITRVGEEIIMGFRGSNALSIINTVTDKTILHTRLKDFYRNGQCSALCYDSTNNRLWVGSNHRYGYYKYPIDSLSSPEKVYPILSHCYGIIQDPNSDLMCVLGAKSFTLLSDTSVVYQSDTFKRMLTSACFKPDGKLVVGSRGDGIRIATIEANFEVNIYQIPSLTISSLQQGLGRTWVVAESDLFTLEEDNTLSPFVVDSNNKVGVHHLFTHRRSLWVGFGRGVYRIREAEDTFGYTIETFPFAKDLASLAKPGTWVIHNGQLYTASMGGVSIYRFNGLSSFNRFASPMVDRVLMNGRVLPRNERYMFDYKQNSMNIELTAPHYKYGFQRFFRYKLQHGNVEEGAWTKLSKPGLNTVNFSHLSPGKYKLLAQVGASSLPWGDTMSMDMEILPPYWQTWWFRSVMLLLFMTIIWQSASYRYRNKQKQLQLELDAMTAHQKALRAQINPHFVFNVIASVQYLVKSSPTKASRFLGHFSSLIRKALDHSFEQWVPLESELDQLEDYLALEQMRLDGNFDYQIDTAALREPERLLIPPALVQPYIENAVWHGLKMKEGDGMLKVKFHSDGDHLKVTIEDNGPGRVKSEETGNHKGSKSHGMLLSAERIKTLNAEQGSFASVDVSDMEKGGTRVVVQLKAKFTDESTIG